MALLSRQTLGGASAAAALAIGVGVSSLALTGSTETTVLNPPPPPANVEVLEVGETHITLGWGPSLPGTFAPGKVTPTSLVVWWGRAKDTLNSPLTYTVRKNNTIVVSGTTLLNAKVGFTKAVRTFRTCVWATNAIAKSGPQMCATWNGAVPTATPS